MNHPYAKRPSPPGAPGDDHAVATVLVTRTRSNGATLTG
jgi:hypothetical protein